MEPGILTAICEAFRNALLPLAPQLVDLLHPSWFAFMRLAFLLLLASLMFGSPAVALGRLFVGTLAIGFTHVLLLYGYQWADGFFRGTVEVARALGAPAIDPSGLVSWGWTISDPIFKALDGMGALSYITSPLIHLTFEAGAWAIAGAFIVLAAMEMGFLLMSYVLVGTAPFFCLFAVVPILQALTMRWVSLVFSAMSGLFVTMFFALVVRNIGQTLLDTLQARFLAPGVTLLLQDYLLPLGVGIVLIISFVWIPLKFAREVGGVAMDIMAGVSGMAFGAAGAVTSALSNNSRTQVSSGGSQGQVAAPQGGGSGAGLGAPQAARQSAWR